MDGAFLESILGLAPPFPSLGSGDTVRQERADWNVLSPLGDKGLLDFKNKHDPNVYLCLCFKRF